MVRKILLWAPLLIFALFLGVFLRGLNAPEETTISSKLIGKRVPEFALPAAVPSYPTLSSRDLAQGKPVLVNIFAS